MSRTTTGQRTWRQLLLGIERDLVLAGSRHGMVAGDLPEYLFARSSGHFASLMSLIGRGCYRAARTGAESLTADLLAAVRIDQAAEDARSQLRTALESGVPPASSGLAHPAAGRAWRDGPAPVHARPAGRGTLRGMAARLRRPPGHGT